MYLTKRIKHRRWHATITPIVDLYRRASADDSGGKRASRFSKDRPRFADTLDVIKFVCKDMWTLVFRKQIDNLKTNHRVRPRLFSSLPVWLMADRADMWDSLRGSTFLQIMDSDPLRE